MLSVRCSLMQTPRKGFIATFRAAAKDAEREREQLRRAHVAQQRDAARRQRVAEREISAQLKARRSAEVERLNAYVDRRLVELESVLHHEFTIHDLRSSSSPEEPVSVAGLVRVPRLSLLRRFSRQARREHAAQVVDAQKIASDQHDALVAERRHAETMRAEVGELNERVLSGDVAATTRLVELILLASPYPFDFIRRVRVACSEASKQLMVEFELPATDVVPDVKEYRYSTSRDVIAPLEWPKMRRQQMYAELLARVTLRVIREAFSADVGDGFDVIVFNGHVESIDPATGRTIRPCVTTLRVTKEAFFRIDLSHVDPIACLKGLHASVSSRPADLVPVRPVLDFAMTDPRFVDAVDVLATLDTRPNLMELTPSEFESLITNLFEKMGLETRQTQASRDGGVDCVAFNTEPILGGKIVIQAKRYKNTVGVSAVRDLYGTVQNEGASKGILVTTSGYGSSAFEFAQNKPIELLEGAHLLYLLSTHAGIDARIEVPNDWKDP